jgi:cytochrome o ubiquinol oxidase subunit 2
MTDEVFFFKRNCRKTISARTRRGRNAGAILSCIGLAACQPAILAPEGQIGIADRAILIDSMAIMLTIVVPTILMIFGVAFWFRSGNTRARRLPDFVYSGRIELVVWAIPLMTIMLLGGVIWIGSHELDPAEPIASKTKPLEIQGISLDWKWLFIYPDQHVAAVNQLVLPAGRPVHFSLTSGSVMNAFFIPRLGSMIYTMNGMVSRLNLIADHPGIYPGLSSHYSGDGFAGMHFEARAIPPDQFDAWAAATHGHGDTLDDGAYTKLARQSMDVAPFTYGDIDPALFAAIVSQRLPQAPGPVENGTPNASISPKRQP